MAATFLTSGSLSESCKWVLDLWPGQFQVASRSLDLSARILLEGEVSALIPLDALSAGLSPVFYMAPLGFVCQIPNCRHSVSHICLKPSGIILDVLQDGGAVRPKTESVRVNSSSLLSILSIRAARTAPASSNLGIVTTFKG